MSVGEMSVRDACLALNGMRKTGPITLNRLLDRFNGDPVAALNAPRSELSQIEGVSKAAIDSMLNWRDVFDLRREKGRLQSLGARFVCRMDKEYPEILRTIHDPPIGLYVLGPYAFSQPAIAIVGSRRTTLYGQAVASDFACELVRRGICVVSGLARGIDTFAHKGALEFEDGKTVAILGSGLDVIYPPENISLYREIGAKGAVVSEFPFGRRADRQTFPMRNRLVSGMSLAVLIVESDEAGGSLITARFAGEQGRLVCAIPGRIDQRTSRGCNQLIRDGAVLVTSVDELLSELQYASAMPRMGQSTGTDETDEFGSFSEEEQEILGLFKGGESLDVDRIEELVDLGSAEISSLLMSLELDGAIEKRLDGSYEAISRRSR